MLRRGPRLAPDEPQVTFAHLADLHLTGPADGRTALTRLALARQEVTEADAIVIAGDVTDRGYDSQLELAGGLLRRLSSERPVIAVPGNHDVSQAWGLGGRRDDADDVGAGLARLAWAGASVRALDAQRAWPIRVDLHGGGAVLYGIDSTRAPPAARNFARGLIGERQLAALDEDIASLEPSQRKVLVLHHHVKRLPIGRQLQHLKAWEIGMALRDRRPLSDLIRRHRVDLVLHGHRHHFLRRKLGATTILSASSTTNGCGLTGQRFFLRVGLGLESGAVDVQRVQYAPPAPRATLEWLFSLDGVADANEAMEAWTRAAEVAYDSEESFVAFAQEFQQRAGRIGTWSDLSRQLDGELAALLQRAEGTPEAPSTNREGPHVASRPPQPSPLAFALLQQSLGWSSGVDDIDVEDDEYPDEDDEDEEQDEEGFAE